MQSSSDCSVRVVCRVRPLNEKEKDTSPSFVVNFPAENSVGVGVSLKAFSKSILQNLYTAIKLHHCGLLSPPCISMSLAWNSPLI